MLVDVCHCFLRMMSCVKGAMKASSCSDVEKHRNQQTKILEKVFRFI